MCSIEDTALTQILYCLWTRVLPLSRVDWITYTWKFAQNKMFFIEAVPVERDMRNQRENLLSQVVLYRGCTRFLKLYLELNKELEMVDKDRLSSNKI